MYGLNAADHAAYGCTITCEAGASNEVCVLHSLFDCITCS